MNWRNDIDAYDVVLILLFRDLITIMNSIAEKFFFFLLFVGSNGDNVRVFEHRTDIHEPNWNN